MPTEATDGAISIEVFPDDTASLVSNELYPDTIDDSETTELSSDDTAKEDSYELFKVKYARKSPIKSIPIKNTTLKLAIFYHGEPKGYTLVRTDKNGNFDYNFGPDDNKLNLSLELVAVRDELKYKAHCYGTTSVDNPKELIINCEGPKIRR